MLEVNAAAESGGVEVEQGTKLGAARDDEVGGEQGRRDVVPVVERDVVDGGVFGAEGQLDGGEGSVEQREGCRLWEVVKDGRIGQREVEHGFSASLQRQASWELAG